MKRSTRKPASAVRANARSCRNLYQFIRKRLGPDLSDREIARRWGMEWKSFADLKHGQRQVPRLRDLERLAGLLKVDPAVVFAVASGGDPGELAETAPDEPALRAQLARVADPIFTVDPTGTLHDATAPLSALTGRSHAQLVGRSLLDLVAPESKAQALALVAAISRGETVAGAELMLSRHQKPAVSVEIDATPICGADGRPLGAQALCRDVSQEQQRMRELDRRRHDLQVLFERIPAACLIYDGKRTIVAVNPPIERVGPATAVECLGRRLADVFGDPGPSCPVTRAFMTGQIEQQVTWRTNRAGQRVYIHRTAGPILDGDKVERVIEIVVDVTDEVRHGDLRLLSFWRSQREDERPTSLSAERRSTPRAEVAFSAQIRHGERTEMVRVENLGPGGLFLRTRNKLAKGTEVELEWLLPNDRVPVRARAVVAWIRPARKGQPGGVGVRFLQMAPTPKRAA